VTIGDSVAAYAAGPVLVPAGSDTLLALWVSGEWPKTLNARVFSGDTWRDREAVAPGAEMVHWPCGIGCDPGRVLVAFYEGSYPVGVNASLDTWAIYTTVRTDTGWSGPELAHDMSTGGFPSGVRLGRDREGELGMVWDESAGGMHGADSVMFSRRTAFGWTERTCLAPGRDPDVNCLHGSLIPGDSTAFIVAYTRWDYPDTSRVLVWDVEDSLVQEPAVFRGRAPTLVRGEDVRYLVFVCEDSVFASENRGEGWQAEDLVATGVGWNAPGLCVDPMGWAWACWPDSSHRAVLASYNRGTGWSVPETVSVFTSLGTPVIASDETGTMHCLWLDHAVGSPGRVRHSYRIERPGVAEEKAEGGGMKAERAGPTILRGPELMRMDCRVLDIQGRDVTERRARLSPGVYFLKPSADGGQPSTVRKVILQR